MEPTNKCCLRPKVAFIQTEALVHGFTTIARPSRWLLCAEHADEERARGEDIVRPL